MFYFNSTIHSFENNKSYNDAIKYLEKLYQKNKTTQVLNSLIAFSWYYLIEGPIDSRLYEKEDTSFAYTIWKKYIDNVISSKKVDASTLYVCGYTLSLHGMILGAEYEGIGSSLMKDALKKCDDSNLKELINAFIEMEKQRKYKPIKISNETLLKLFDSHSLVGKYFVDLYKQ